MEYKMEIKPYDQSNPAKVKIIEIAYLGLHHNTMRASNAGKEIRQSFKLKRPGRIFSPINGKQPSFKMTILDQLKNDTDFREMVQEEEKKGYKVLIEIPENLPILASKDIEDYVGSVKGKRISRRIAKKKPIG